MKKNYLCKLLWAISFVGLFTACDNDDYDGPAPDEVTANYSNKLADGDRANLALTYGGSELIGKSVYFKTTDAKAAEMTLINMLPHESQTKIENISLTPDGNNGYAFSGNATAADTRTTFKYDGTVTDGKLALNLSEVKVPENELSSTGTWGIVHTKTATLDKTDTIKVIGPVVIKKDYYTYYTPTYGKIGKSGGILNGAYAFILENMFSQAINSLLNQITFHADGNITAAYNESGQWVDSPVNLASYYVKDTLMYVTPNVDMIIRQIRLNKTTMRAVDNVNLIESLEKIYAKLNEWSTTGIPLVIRQNSQEYSYYTNVESRRNEGDILLVLKKEEIRDLFALIDIAKVIIEKASPGALTKPIPQLLADMGVQIPPEYQGLLETILGKTKLDDLLNQLANELETQPLELGIYLNNN